MKKTIFGVMLLLGIGATTLNAQTTTFGVKAEANLSNLTVSKNDALKSDMGIGATLGGFAKIDVVRNFAIQPELLFHFQNSKMKINGTKYDTEMWAIEVPVYALGQWNCGSGNRFYAGVGPYVSYGVGGKIKDFDTKIYKDDVLKEFDFGGKALVGYEFSNGIQINASYKYGILDVADKVDGKIHNQMISLGVGYRF